LAWIRVSWKRCSDRMCGARQADCLPTGHLTVICCAP